MNKLQQAQSIVRLSALRSELIAKATKALETASNDVTIANIDEARFALIELDLVQKELKEKMGKYE